MLCLSLLYVIITSKRLLRNTNYVMRVAKPKLPITLCTLYKAFIRSIFLCFSRLVSLLTSTHITSVEKMHRFSCRIITGYLSSTPIFLVHLEALLPPLRINLTHQSFSYFQRALRLPPSFPLASLAHLNSRTRFK